MRLGTPGPQFRYYFWDPFAKLGIPLKTRTRVPRGCSIAFKLLDCCQKVHQVIQNLLHIKRMDCNSLLIHQSVSDGYFADWQHCRCRRLQRQWTSRCWEPQEWSEIHLQPNPPVPSIWYLSKRLSQVWRAGSAKEIQVLQGLFVRRWCRFFILGEITGLQWAPSGLHPPQLCGCMTV